LSPSELGRLLEDCPAAGIPWWWCDQAEKDGILEVGRKIVE